jgi:hypothetical protein
MPATDDTDAKLLLLGVPEDFGRFYDRHVRTVLGYFQRRTGNPELAADLAAETFAAALVARRRFKPGPVPASSGCSGSRSTSSPTPSVGAWWRTGYGEGWASSVSPCARQTWS